MELKDQMQKAVAEFRTALEQRDNEVKELGEARTETKNTIAALDSRISELETAISRPRRTEAEARAEKSVEQKAFLQWARKGAIAPEYQKSLALSDDTLGGYLAPEEYVRQIIKNVTEFSPVRQVAKVMQTSATAVKIPKRSAQFSAAWVAEQGTRSETTGLTYGLEELSTHEMYALVDLSQQLLEDSVFNIESELMSEFSEQFSVLEATAFVSGNGVGKPEGLLSASGVATTNSGVATNVGADAFFDVFYGIKDYYARSASWMMNRSTISEVRQLQDGNGQYLWQPGLQPGQPSSLLGRPIIEATDMPAVGASAKSVIFGDFRSAYTIVDRVSMSVQRDPYTQATLGNVRFIARRRVGAQVVQAEAIRIMVCST